MKTFFECKIRYEKVAENGMNKKVSEQYLVDALSFTEAEARIIELACGPVPEGHSRWTLRLLEKEAKVVLDTPVSKDAIRRALKKTNFDLTKMNTGAFPQERTQNL